MKIPGLKSRIGLRLIIYILLFSSAVTLIGTGLDLYLEFDRDIQSIHTTLKQVESSYLQSIIDSLWVTDDELLQIQLEGILQLPDMQLIEIRKGAEVLQGVGAPPQAEHIIEQSFPLTYVYDGQEVQLGELHLVASLKGVYARILDRVWVILNVQILETFLVALFIFFLFYQLVGRHITHMASYVESMRFESMDEPLHLNRKPHMKNPDELDQLATSFNRMRENLARYLTERKRVEEQIKQQQYYLEKAQELGRIGTWELDLVKNRLYWTDENCRIFGVPAKSVVDYEIFIEKVHPDDREYVNREWISALDGKPYDIEHRLVVDGVTRWVREKADVEFDKERTAIRAVGFTQDITERKQMDEELNKHREHLEDLVQEKTKDLRKMVNAMAGRENRMADLKGTIKQLRTQLEEAGMTPAAADSMEDEHETAT
jgi:PAS domain S-box-containing protein